MQLKMRRFQLCSAILVAFSASPLFAQTFGEITGHISDSSGSSVAAATITLTNVATNASRTGVSTDSGDYTFPAVAPGFYNIKIERAGFKSVGSNSVQVQVQQTVRLDYTLQVGQITESIEVSASAEMLQAENVSLGTVIENKGVTELPLNGRNYLGLVALSANTNTLSSASGQAGGRQGGDRANQSISAGGNRIMFDFFTLDGVTNTDPDFSTYVVLPSIDAIQEFKVQTGIYPAEFGHQSTQINVLTKSGGNAFHGALFEFVRNDKFDAVPYAFTATHPVKSPFKWNDYGFEVDGPIYIPKIYNGRNRLFFMANDEWKAQRQHSQSTYSVPTAAMFTGDFGAWGTTIYDPNSGATRTPFPNNVIPSNRIDPISKKFLNYYVPSNLPGFSNNYTQTNSFPNNRDAFTLRMDFVESVKSQWTGRYSWGDENQSSTGINITGSKILTNYEQYLGTNTRTLTPTIVNEARFGYTRLSNSLGTYSAYNVDSVTPLGIPNLQPGQPVAWGVPYASFAGDGFTAIGDTQDGPYFIDDNTLQLVDNISWTHGKHSLRMGFEYNRQNFNQIGNQFSRGQFSFQAYATQSSAKAGGDAFADFLLGDIYTSVVAVALATAKFQRNTEAAFIDDTWKITPKVTLTLGMRYELTPPWTDTVGNEFSVAIPRILAVSRVDQADPSLVPYMIRQGNCSDPYAGPPALNIRWTTVSAKCSGGSYPNQLLKTSYKDWAPRIGIAISPNSKTVIRAGWGLFYNQEIGNAYFDMARNIAGRVTYTAGATPDLFYSNAVPAASGALANVPSPYAYAMSLDHHTSYAMQFAFNVQNEFAKNWALEVGYLGGLSRHLQGFQDINQALPGTVGSANSRMPYPGFSNIQLVQDGTNANYNALSVKVTRRFSQGISVISSYTWSKSIDATSGIRNQGYDTLYPQNSYCLSCERGLSSFDTRQRIVTSVLYDLPMGKNKMLHINNSVANTIIGDWQLGGILTLQSGMPGNLGIGGVDNASTAAGGYDRPNATGVSPYLDNPTPSRYYNLAAFTEAPAGQFGNVGRNAIIGPGIIGFDSEVHKSFKMPYKEGHVLQFRFEAFNVLNHPNWQMPTLNILSGAVQAGKAATDAHQNFGVVSSIQGAMRQIQLGLKYSF